MDTKIMISLNDFIKQNPPKNKIDSLSLYEKDIRTLRGVGMSFSQIADYLKQNNVLVSTETVRKYIKNLEKTKIDNFEQTYKIENKITPIVTNQLQGKINSLNTTRNNNPVHGDPPHGDNTDVPPWYTAPETIEELL